MGKDPESHTTEPRENRGPTDTAKTSLPDHSEDPPRIVLRFGIYACVAFALAAILIILLVRHFTIEQAEQSAIDRARYVSEVALGGQLQPGDFEGPVSDLRREELDHLFERLVLVQGTVAADLVGRNGVVTYSTQHARIGTDSDRATDAADVLAGQSVGRTDSLDVTVDGVRAEREVFTILLPHGFARESDAGVFVTYLDYGPIAGAARGSFLPIAGVFEIAIVALTIGLVPALRRLTRRIRTQMEEIERRAYFDALTSLPNRALFEDRLEQSLTLARREGRNVGVLLMDVNGFKDVNDTLGHRSGDDLLTGIAGRIRHALRDTDSVSRLSGDQFAVIVANGDADTLATVSERIKAGVERPFAIEGVPIDISLAMGAALAPDHGETVQLLLQHAEVAMYQAKEARSSLVLYDPDTDTSDADRLALLAELRQAVEEDQFVLEYQPKANMTTHAIQGAEVLVRWQHPKHGRLGPEGFIPLAEHTGLIRPLSRLVLRRALHQTRAWRKAGFDMSVAVNLSMVDLVDADLPGELAAMIHDTGLPPRAIELEITESLIMDDPFTVNRTLAALSDLGVRLAIDDFGTGHSSLGHLRALPVDTLKIDKSFVLDMNDDPSNAAIVRSTIDLARTLGLEVVAEGVESLEVWQMLASYGCHYAQGYGLAKPMSAQAMNQMLAGFRHQVGPETAAPVALSA